MQKTLITLSITMVAFLIFGSLLFPESAALWLASTSDAINIVRILLLSLLFGLLYTRPPRKVWFRRTLGLSAVLVGVFTAAYAHSHALQILDMLVFMQVAVIFGLAALEQPARKIEIEDVPSTYPIFIHHHSAAIA